MRVYIVIDHDIESDVILGVYADKDAAGDAQNRNAKDQPVWEGATIEVWEVQE